MAKIPISFKKLVAAFPDHDHWTTKKLLDTIAGEVRESLNDSVNTCAVRLSFALNRAGKSVHKVPGVSYYKGGAYPDPATEGDVHPRMRTDLYVYRVLDMKTYLERQYGAGKLIYDGHHPDKFKVPFTKVTQGIIVFVWQGRWADFNASGHVDLFRVVLVEGKPPRLVPGCVGTCYFETGAMLAYFWEMLP
jgi:hypothetical protein